MVAVPNLRTLTTKRAYRDLEDYASAHHGAAEDFLAAGWSPYPELRKGRWALKFQTHNGPRWRFIDGAKPTYDNPIGYQSCWYLLEKAIEIHRTTGQPLVDCNGAASAIIAQKYGI